MRHDHLAIAVSLVGLPFIMAHVVEDFAQGIAQRFGLSTAVGALLLGAWLALQSFGLVLLGRGRRAGRVITLVVGLVWVAGAVADHGRPILAGGFRSGAPSVIWVVMLIATQATAAALAWRGWRRA